MTTTALADIRRGSYQVSLEGKASQKSGRLSNGSGCRGRISNFVNSMAQTRTGRPTVMQQGSSLTSLGKGTKLNQRRVSPLHPGSDGLPGNNTSRETSPAKNENPARNNRAGQVKTGVVHPSQPATVQVQSYAMAVGRNADAVVVNGSDARESWHADTVAPPDTALPDSLPDKSETMAAQWLNVIIRQQYCGQFFEDLVPVAQGL